jgi:hypothetical protein
VKHRERTAISATAATADPAPIAIFVPVESVEVVATLLLDLLPESEPDGEELDPESVVEPSVLALGAPYVALIRSAARSAMPYAVAIV